MATGPVYEALTEEESYLWAILTDPAGLDLFEFAMPDEEGPDGIYRAWPFQWSWYRESDSKQIEQCARAVGKSQRIVMRACSFPFRQPGREFGLTAPEGNHLDALTDKVETKVLQVRLFREMLVPNTRTAIKHRPFQMNWRNGARLLSRIPQRDGRGVKGLHPHELHIEEAQDYPERGWSEVIETVNRSAGGFMWGVHGVTRGVRDQFFKLSQPNSGWKVLQYTAMHRPTWSDEERAEKISLYGSPDAPDYKRNVLGEHGDAASPIFVLHRLMACVDDVMTSDYNTETYQNVRITGEEISADMPVEMLVGDLPTTHIDRKLYPAHWLGADIGFTLAPTEILAFGETVPKKGEDSQLVLLARFNVARVGHSDQVDLIQHLISFYRPRVFAMDKTGNGLPLFQDLQSRAEADPEMRWMVDAIRGYNFSSKILVDFDLQDVDWDELADFDQLLESGIHRTVLEFSTDVLRDYVDRKRLVLPWDPDVIGEMQGQTFTVIRSGTDQYGRKTFSRGKFHALDAMRMMALGHRQFTIETIVRDWERRQMQDAAEPVLDGFIG